MYKKFKIPILFLFLTFLFSCNRQKEITYEHKLWDHWTKQRALSTAHYGSAECQIWNDRGKTVYLYQTLNRCTFDYSKNRKNHLGKLLFEKERVLWIDPGGQSENLFKASNLFDLGSDENGPDFLKIAKTPVEKDHFLSAEIWKAKSGHFSYFLSFHNVKNFKNLKKRLTRTKHAYFKYNPALKVKAQFMESHQKKITLYKSKKNSTTELYKKGTLSFRLFGKKQRLSVYSQEDGTVKKYLMFKDLTSGTTTFGGGRYLKTPDLKSAQIEIDFNFSLNPKCAYSSAWNCTVPDDSLSVQIQAGEKYFSP